jgi:hypothetical protein
VPYLDGVQFHEKREYESSCFRYTYFDYLQAKYAYRSIANFVRHVTNQDEDYLKGNPFPPSELPVDSDVEDNRLGKSKADVAATSAKPQPKTETGKMGDETPGVLLGKDKENANAQELKNQSQSAGSIPSDDNEVRCLISMFEFELDRPGFITRADKLTSPGETQPCSWCPVQ